MKSFRDIAHSGSVVTIGTFDGLHRGHRAVLECLKREADRRGLMPVVVTFDRHPLEIVAPDRAPGLIMPPDMRDDMLRSAGVHVLRIEFSEEVRYMKCRDWLQKLRDELRMEAVVIGYDNTFGSDGRSMTMQDYTGLGEQLLIDVVEAPEVQGCSSSTVRKALLSGDVEMANNVLGRPFCLCGKVVEGARIGRTIGVPTANLSLYMRQLLPAQGVYAATAMLRDGSRYKAVVNIGVNPTVSDRKEVRVEAHLLDLAGNLYGDDIEVEFITRIRDERKFASLQELKQTLQADISHRRELADKACMGDVQKASAAMP